MIGLYGGSDRNGGLRFRLRLIFRLSKTGERRMDPLDQAGKIADGDIVIRNVRCDDIGS